LLLADYGQRTILAAKGMDRTGEPLAAFDFAK
jgi:hypothetical protein